MIQDARGWCTGMTQRDDMGREVEGGSGWGMHVHPWRIHVNVWQNQYNIVKLKKKKENDLWYKMVFRLKMMRYFVSSSDVYFY